MRHRLPLALLLVATMASAAAAEPKGKAAPPPGPDGRTALRVTQAQADQQRENMRSFLAAVQEIVAAVARDDFAKAEAAAKTMGHTPEREKKARKLGGTTPGFVDQALGFLKAADATATAARGKDGKAVLKALDQTLATCNACHAAFRLEMAADAK